MLDTLLDIEHRDRVMAPSEERSASGSRRPSGESAGRRPANAADPLAAAVQRSGTPTQSLVTGKAAVPARSGQGRMVFRPKLPPRRQLVKQEGSADEPVSVSASVSPAPSPVRPSPRRSRNAPPEMVASGPFAQRTGNYKEESGVQAISSSSTKARGGAGEEGTGSGSAAQSRRREDISSKSQGQVYSDGEEDDVEIVDMENVANMDELAPQSIPQGKGFTAREGDNGAVNPASDPGEEEAMDDLIGDFYGERADDNKDLLLLQFPPIFPQFARPDSPNKDPRVKARRSVAFADDTRGGGGAAGATVQGMDGGKMELDEAALDAKSVPAAAGLEGQIGRLDVYSDGRVQMLFGDKIVMEVTGASQSTFLQQVMLINAQGKEAVTIGNVCKKYVVAPEITAMLEDTELAEAESSENAGLRNDDMYR